MSTVTYGVSLNIEASIIDYLTSALAVDWSNVSIGKNFERVYELSLPCICIRTNVTMHEKLQLGSYVTVRDTNVLMDIFATNDIERANLKDYLITKIKGTIPYYEYVIEDGAVDTKTQDGYLTVTNIDDSPINFTDDKTKMDIHDKYRHVITIKLISNKVET